MQQTELIDSVKSYDVAFDEEVLGRACDFVIKAHGSQKRLSGEPFYFHPFAVAKILTEYKLDIQSIITAVLHDTIEDTAVTAPEIAQEFGEEVANLVEGVTKLTQIELQSGQSDQAENFRKLVLAMSEDIRVLIVKLADRLHNMRTIQFIPKSDKRIKVSRETMEIYAPLAERLGMQEMKDELEDLAFAEIYPDARNSINARLQFLREDGKDNVQFIVAELKETLSSRKLRARVSGREKTAYSIWKKTQRKNLSFEQISDIVAFRVIVESASDCYRALGIINQSYRVVPGRIKDYISTPKQNGYQSIHTSVIGPKKQRIEIQIRTLDMHEISEIGVAAHWLYKEKGDIKSGREFSWMRELLEILENAENTDDFLENTKLEMFPDQVFCFTPTGDVIALPSGATPVDFAYAVHSEVGDHCVGAMVNSRSMPLRTELENGDQVEIITSMAQKPSPTWENFVVTGKARAHIRRFIRSRENEEYINLGRVILVKTFESAGYQFSDELADKLYKDFEFESQQQFLAEVGRGLLIPRRVLEKAYPDEYRSNKRGIMSLSRVRSRWRKSKEVNKGQQNSMEIKGLIPGMAIHYGTCCHPLPGDKIVGILTKGVGVVIHTTDCEELKEFSKSPERCIDLSWNLEAIEKFYLGRIKLVVNNTRGSLGKICTTIGNNTGNISNLKITNRSAEFFDILIDVEVGNIKQLVTIIAPLRALSEVKSVERI